MDATRAARLRRAGAAVLVLAFAATLPAQGPAGETAPSRDFAVRCGTLLVGDGKTSIAGAWLVVRDGKVAQVGTDAPPPDLPVVDCSQKVVMPGIVAVDSDFGGAADSDYQVTPDALAVDSFDFDRKWIPALQGGVTTAYLSPGRERLVSGQGAVVKIAGRDIVERVLNENVCLRVNFGDGALRAPRVFEPVPHPTSDEPLEQARIQTPTSRIGLLAELRALFAAATDPAHKIGGEGPAENRYDEQPLADVVGGKLPLRAGAFRTQDIRRALQLQQELGVRMVLENPQEIGPVAAQAAAQKVAATFRVPIRFGQPNPGGEDRQQKTPEPRPEAPARAAAAGMLVGLSPAPGVSPRDWLVAVGFAVRHGLSVERALRSVNADAAAILGVDARVGTLAPGKDADFVVLSGEPLAIGTMVEATWIDGRRVYARTTETNALAVRVGRILDAAGHVFRNGVILVQDGRIKGVGEDLAIPYGARVVDVPGGVMTPGFLDAFSHLGLAGDGAPVPPGQPNQRLHDAVAPDDPMFGPALAEGLTTVLVSGKDQGAVNGRVAAIKTGAQDRDGMVLSPIAGLRLAHDAIGPDAIRAFADQVNRGKQYVEQWRKYEKELAEWQQGKKAPPPPPPAPTDGAPVEDPVSGTWEAEIDVQGQMQVKVALDLVLEGTKVTGTIRISFAGRDLPPQEITSGSWADGKLKLEFRGMGGSASLEATLQGDTLTGKFTMGRMGEQDVTGKRTSKAGAPAPAAAAKKSDKPTDDGKPKAPNVDENLEPMRAAIEKKAALVVRVSRGAAIAAVVELLEKEQIPYVLQGADDLVDDPSFTAGKKPPVLLGPDVLIEEKGLLRNVAAIFADRDLPILFGTGDCAGARFLAAHAANAVRYGLSPSDALLALTAWPARAFRLADRVGSLEKGKDADFVVFSGDPFEPTSRVLLVVCNGVVVKDLREEQR
ncbi:MAG: amidohydrolase family protein [Planctomycetes bacterium]|nr:amidohydrolase family protein [Planctomycetota bacterium]